LIRPAGGEDEFLIEGFGASTDKPFVSAKAKARKPRRPGGP